MPTLRGGRLTAQPELVDSFHDATGLGFVPLLAIALALCIAVAAVSYTLVERPFLRLRRRWS